VNTRSAESPEHPELSARQAYLLGLVVRDFVRLAQPVGSETILTRHGMGVSPATVRCELARLEAAGLLTHPHTSAGRVPTVAGYRYFVEYLMSSAGLSEAQQITIRHQFHQAGADLERWMRLSATVMAHTSGAAGLVASEDDQASPRLYHAGLVQILDDPEFTDSARLREVVEILEHGQGLEPIMARLPRRGVQVIIGGEPPLERAPHVTLVLSRFGAASRPRGVLGVVGPMRLPYERAVPTVGFVAELMTEFIVGDAA
jgi:transcriptional regulator of heat shock response